MEIEPRITYRDFDPPLLADQPIRERIGKLERIAPRIIGCNVVAETLGRQHQTGNLYHFRIEVSVPGDDLVVNKQQNDKHAHEDFFVAMRDAFDAMERQLRARSAKIRGDIKTHVPPPHGRIIKLFDDYGFIEPPGRAEVYFHANAVIEARFADLEIGQEVWFNAAENESEKGPQATMVRPAPRLPPG
jgi:cold shock CspA family protein/ribosome-associated translation inhibitor RaiA